MRTESIVEEREVTIKEGTKSHQSAAVLSKSRYDVLVGRVKACGTVF